jgi:hypothetical protein
MAPESNSTPFLNPQPIDQQSLLWAVIPPGHVDEVHFTLIKHMTIREAVEWSLKNPDSELWRIR